MKLNCWEFKNCGREPGGTKTDEMGVCPAATHDAFNGVHSGKKAGRACWAIATSLCGGRRQGVFAQKLDYCKQCEFFHMVKNEEETGGRGFAVTPSGIQLYVKMILGSPLPDKEQEPSEDKVIGSRDIRDVEKRFLSFAGYQGTKMVDSVFIDLRYKRGNDMTPRDFASFLRYLLQCLCEDHHELFLGGLPKSINILELDY